MTDKQFDSRAGAGTARVRRLDYIGFAALFVLALGLMGCGAEDEIRTYRVPKAAPVVAPAPKTRLLAALFPQADKTWAIKLMGPVADVAKHAEAFHKFVESIRLTPQADPPLAWTLPEGWRTAKEVAFSVATFQLGSEDHALQVSVTPVAGNSATAVLDNINRWRGQLGLA